MHAIRENLRLVIALRDTTPTQVARDAGLSVNAVSAFIRGKTSMSHENLTKVCEVLNVPIGLLSRPEGISPQRLRLQQILDRMPDYLTPRALAVIEQALKDHPPE